MRVDGCPAGTPEAAIYGSEGNRLCAQNVFNWRDAMTLRVGAEYAIKTQDSDDVNVVRPRLGFVFDDQTSNIQYPSAFGTPPGPTYTLTAGVGFDGGPWEANLAYAYRTGSATVTDSGAELTPSTCRFCGYNGDYNIVMNGIYLDFSYDFE
jgi:long-subunit fatty acid transport protein